MPRRLSSLLLLLAALLGAGCAPLVNRPGPAAAAPLLARSHFVAADGAVLPVRSWLPQGGARAALVALHGFNDYSRFFEGAGAYLAGRGVACYAYDQRGFGNAPGRGVWAGVEAYADDLKAFVGGVRRRHPGVPVYVLGESMGGAVAMVAMASPPPAGADGLILSAPAVWGRSTMPWWQRALLEAAAHTVPWLRPTGEGLKIVASDNVEMLRGLGRDPLVIKATRLDAVYGLADLMDAALASAPRLGAAALVLYGERDQVVPKAPVLKMLAEMPAARTRAAFYENGYHMLLRDLQAEKPWADIAAWIDGHDAPLPSGADRRAAAEGLCGGGAGCPERL